MILLGFMWIMVQCVIGIKKVISTSFTQTTSFIDHQGKTLKYFKVGKYQTHIVILKYNYYKFNLNLDKQINQQYNQGHSQCGSVQLFGGNHEFDLSTGIVKLFNLPPHYKLYLSFEVYIIDTLIKMYIYISNINNQILFISYCMASPQAMNVIIDQIPTQMVIPMASINLCGQYQVDQTYNIVINQFHSYPTAIISIFSSIDSSTVYWGIRDFVLSVDTCPLGCQICFQESQVFECFQWKLFHKSWSSTDINDFDNDGWYTSSVTGPTECAQIPIYGGYNSMTVGGSLQRTFKLPSHSNLFFIFRFVKIDNWSGEFGIVYLIYQRYYNNNNRNDKQIHNTFRIENSNFQVLYNGAGTQKNYCGNSMYSDQFHIHGIEYLHDVSTITILIYSEQYNSERFYGIRDFYIYGYTLPSYCGDGVIDENEQCDDGNIFAFDDCFNCQYSCIEGCSKCIDGICLICQDDWMFDFLNDQCIYQYFNNLYQQIVIDNNQQQNQLKQYQQYINNYQIDCIQFNQDGQCIKCKVGYELFEYCQPICGDGIVIGILQIQFKIEFLYQF